ncbi:MAG TPA: HipA domain-containing protein [Nannocystis sp.]
MLGIHLSALGATLSGVRVPPIRMGRVEEIEGLPDEIPIGDGTMYLIERFDRDPRGGRVHMEDMGQILDRPPGSGQFEGAYEQIAAVLAAIAPGSLREFCQRLAFCVVCGNTDAHLKNWSVVYPDRRHAELSPAYDIIAAVLYAPERIDDRLALELGNAHAFESVTLASFKRLAAVSGVDFSTLGGWIREAVQRAREAWHAHAHELAFLPSERRRLEAHMARVPLLTAS